MSTKIEIGEVHKTFNEPYSSGGCLLMIIGMFGLTILFFADVYGHTPMASPLRFIAYCSLVMLAVIGAALLAYSYRASMESAYLEDGHCRIVSQTVNCRGGCNRCPFAAQYLAQLDRERTERSSAQNESSASDTGTRHD